MSTSPAIKVFATEGVSTRKFVLPEPMKVDGLYWGVQLNTHDLAAENADKSLRAVNAWLYDPNWVRNMAKRIVSIEGVYSFVSDNAREIEISLESEYRWDSKITDEKGNRVMLKRHVQEVLAGNIRRRDKKRYCLGDFPAKAEQTKSLYYAR